MSHTPGPWEARPWKDKISFGVGPVGHHQDVVSVFQNTYLPGTSEANARLIAAAPDLLELVQEGATLDKVPGTYAERCRAAIAKAEREE